MSFGTSYAGLIGAGLGVPVGAPIPGSAYERNVDLVSARALDLPARDYLVDDDETGSPHGEWDGLAQTVALRLTTRRGRLPFDRALGNDFLNLDRVPVDLAGFAQRCAVDALGDLISTGQVRLQSVTADRSRGLAVMTVVWVDTRTQTERTAVAVAQGA